MRAGFGKFGQFLAKTFVKNHNVYCVSKEDKSAVAKDIGCDYFPLYDLSSFAKVNCDVILLSVSIISFEEVLRSLPKDVLKGKLVVDVLSVKVLPLTCRHTGKKRLSPHFDTNRRIRRR
jgi:prephenate dehydrogenase